MRVLAAFDKFKDSLSAERACEIAVQAIHAHHRDWTVDACPLSDGGDGFAEILTRSAGGKLMRFQASGPHGAGVEAAIGLVPLARIPAAARALLDLPDSLGTGLIAVIEMASASGLSLLSREQRDPWQTTTLGTGQLIHAAAELGVRAILLGVGGSATHDLGLGALEALGLNFLNAAGGRLSPPVPASWPRLSRIEGSVSASIPPIRIACDVKNPVLGPTGAAAIYGPQKGLAAEDFPRLDAASTQVVSLLCAHVGQSTEIAALPGAGAAGGIAFGLMAAAGARLLPGFELVAAWLDLAPRIGRADLVLTGEGHFDDSSLSGKGPGAVARMATAAAKEVHIFAGRISTAHPPAGVHLHPITPEEMSLSVALREAPLNLLYEIETAFPGGA